LEGPEGKPCNRKSTPLHVVKIIFVLFVVTNDSFFFQIAEYEVQIATVQQSLETQSSIFNSTTEKLTNTAKTLEETQASLEAVATARSELESHLMQTQLNLIGARHAHAGNMLERWILSKDLNALSHAWTLLQTHCRNSVVSFLFRS
jgi:septal ring factor EnvC (AmiA/AmiB activator)